MEDKNLGRRAFLKLAAASAAAAGLSHFQFLNPGTAVVLAQNPCEPGDDPDACDPVVGNPDLCAPSYDPDECLPGNPGDPDICAPPNFDPDECLPPVEPDVCAPPDEQDVCLPPDDPDVCDPAIGEPDGPMAVTLTSFGATPVGNAIRVEWETSSEVDNLGFYLYRAKSADGTLSRLTESLIPAQTPGSPVGATYAFFDEAVEPGLSYYYWLDDVDVYGVATRHGPVSAKVSPERRLLPARPRLTPVRPILGGK